MLTICGFESHLHFLGILINRPGQLSLVIPLWVAEMSTGDGHDYC